jgi:hypothetical protein
MALNPESGSRRPGRYTPKLGAHPHPALRTSRGPRMMNDVLVRYLPWSSLCAKPAEWGAPARPQPPLACAARFSRTAVQLLCGNAADASRPRRCASLASSDLKLNSASWGRRAGAEGLGSWGLRAASSGLRVSFSGGGRGGAGAYGPGYWA